MRSLKESIGFSSELASIYAESIRVISDICRNRFGLTYSQFMVMKILSSAEEGLRAGDLACAVGLKISSLWLLLLDLEDKGLIVKESEEDDRRVMRCSLSAEGASVIAECNSEVLDTLVKRYWIALPDREFFEYARSTIDDNLARLKGESADSAGVPHSPSDVLTASFLVFLRVLTERWTEACRLHQLTLAEARLLVRLVDGETRPSDVSEDLFMTKSLVTRLKARMSERGLIHEKENPDSGQSVLLTLTPSGARAAQEVLVELDRVTRGALVFDRGAAMATLNAWHTRIYLNMRAERSFRRK